MVYWCGGLSGMTEAQEHFLLAHTPPFRRDKALRYHFRADRLRSLVAFALLSVGLGHRPDRFVENEYGCPALPGGGPHFNLTHAKDLAAAALDDYPIGVDAEALAPPPEGVKRRVFTPVEIAQIEGADAPERAFFVFWTLKESYIKAIGRGFSFPLQEVSFTLTGDGIVCSDPGFVLTTHTLAGHQLSVCARGVHELTELTLPELLDRYGRCAETGV